MRTGELGLPTQITRFALAASAAAMVDCIGVVIAVGIGAPPVAANAVSFLCGSTTAYLINRRWTFSSRRDSGEIGLAAVTYLGTLLLVLSVNAAVLVLWPRTVWAVTVAWVFSRAVGVTVNFLAQRFLVFG